MMIWEHLQQVKNYVQLIIVYGMVIEDLVQHTHIQIYIVIKE